MKTDQEKKDVYKTAFGKEYDDPSRKQHPLPLSIAYEVAVHKLKKEKIGIVGVRMVKR
jgi:hypothetical protein